MNGETLCVVLMERDIPDDRSSEIVALPDGTNVFPAKEAVEIAKRELKSVKEDEANFSDETFDDWPTTRVIGTTRSDGAWWKFSIIPLEGLSKATAPSA